eukprot:CAMPEP_0184281840 /NCGR_PEP_ID=MMETSP0977-20130417/62174_1 /TAXON_ID=483370 /ORGANISM="non described non described, Strain CCMP2097" /LENGTH=85 /DNA_ID=CAMNT_0026587827 /DNA_START=257 /DNA_END=511 /DNA_ORIENTATION=-
MVLERLPVWFLEALRAGREELPELGRALVAAAADWGLDQGVLAVAKCVDQRHKFGRARVARFSELRCELGQQNVLARRGNRRRDV